MSNEFIERGIERIEYHAPIACNFIRDINYNEIFLWFFLPLLSILGLILLFKYRDVIEEYLLNIFSKSGFIKICMIQDNKNIKEKLIKLDKYNNFKFKNRKYNLDKMTEFIIGYQKNMPVFIYSFRFIFPMKMEKIKIEDEIKRALKKSGIENDDMIIEEKIQALVLKIDSSTLNLVYDKKLLSDLYSISSGDSELRNKIFWAVVISIGLIVSYYTGLLDIVLSYLT